MIQYVMVQRRKSNPLPAALGVDLHGRYNTRLQAAVVSLLGYYDS
jgi:hypothetical protein